MQVSKGDHCPHDDCSGVLRIDKSTGKSVISCDCHPIRHYTLITQQQAAAWERREIVEIDFDVPPSDDHWFRDSFLSHAERAA